MITTTKKNYYVIFCTLVAVVLALSGETAFGQDCGCPPNLCCSQWGYCGSTDAYCGPGCQEGPCHVTLTRNFSVSAGQQCGCPPNLCCSKWGYCGSSEDYCGQGCQEGPCKDERMRSISVADIDVVLALPGETAFGQQCGCPSNLCCSQWGYCGLGQAYCGPGCQEGPCYDEPTRNISVADIVTDEFFNAIADHAGPSCPGKNFYSRTAFLESLDTYPSFASGSDDVAKREIAALFAHVTHETGSFCYIEEINGESYDYCDADNIQYPCVPGKKYYGRGPIQLSWNYNYGPAGQSIGFDGLHDPDIVARDTVISFKTALWFWMTNCHNAITSGRGFGATIRAINIIECDGGNQAAVNARVKYFTNYCDQFGVDPGDNLYC